MTFDYRKPLVTVLLPLAVLAGAWGLWLNVGVVPLQPSGVFAWVPDLVALAGAGLAWKFHRTRVVFALLVVVAASRVLAGFAPGEGTTATVWGQVVYAAVCVLAPVNLLFIAFFDERGIVTKSGLTRLGVMAAQALLVAFVGAAGTSPAAKGLQTLAADLLHTRLFEKDFDIWTWLPQPAMLAFAAVFAVLFVRALVTRQDIDNGLLGVTVALVAALHFVGKGPAPVLFLLLAGGIAIAALFLDGYHMAFTDELTGLPARRALMADARKLTDGYSVAMADVDHFKKFNDTHGHDVGDQVLRMVGAHLRKVGGGGKAYRYGGEEFTILFPARPAGEAKTHLDEVRERIAHAGFVVRSPERPDEKPPEPRGIKAVPTEMVSVTISMGVADAAEDGSDVEAVLKRADQALYKSKEAGRNAVTVAKTTQKTM